MHPFFEAKVTFVERSFLSDYPVEKIGGNRIVLCGFECFPVPFLASNDLDVVSEIVFFWFFLFQLQHRQENSLRTGFQQNTISNLNIHLIFMVCIYPKQKYS